MSVNPVELMNLEVAFLAKDITGSAQVGDYVSLKGYQGCLVILMQAAWAGGAPAVTLHQATDVAATAEKALAYTKRWTKVGVTGTTWVETAVTSSTFNLATVANTMHAIWVPSDSLDVSGAFDCMCCKVATPGTNADLFAGLYMLCGARYIGAVMADAKVD